MSMIDNDWLPAIQGEFRKPYYRELYTFVREEYSRTVVYPPAEDIFNAFHFTPLSEVKVLLLGQDPVSYTHLVHLKKRHAGRFFYGKMRNLYISLTCNSHCHFL